MKAEYRIVQFRENSDRQEGRNFAIIVHDGCKSYLRATGLGNGGALDLKAFEHLMPKAPAESWMIAEWVGWFHSVVENEGKDRAVLDQMLNEVASKGGMIAVLDIVEIDYPEAASFGSIIDDLELRLIGKSSKVHSSKFFSLVEDFLVRSSLNKREGFGRNIEIDVVDGDVVETIVTFPFVVEEKRRLAFKTIATTGRKDLLARQVNDARISFQAAKRCGFVKSENDCIVLTESIPLSSRRYTDTLKGIARFVDVTQEVPPDLLMHENLPFS